MSRLLAVALVAGAGLLVGAQPPVNARLGRSIGSVQAATFSFVVGTVALALVATLFYGGLGSFSNVGKAPWWALVGGLLGAVYVTVAILTVRTLGVSGLTAIVITGQLAAAVAIGMSVWRAREAKHAVRPPASTSEFPAIPTGPPIAGVSR